MAAESRTAAPSSPVAADVADGAAGKAGGGGVQDSNAKGVYLKDLLREYKGELFVPEEAFRDQITETRAFEEALRAVPEMSPQEFVRMAGSGQIKTVTTRCVGLRGKPAGAAVAADQAASGSVSKKMEGSKKARAAGGASQQGVTAEGVTVEGGEGSSGYWEILVDLKPAPGEQKLHRNRW